MPVLTYYVPATHGAYADPPSTAVSPGETFGSQGATVCVIILLRTVDDNLFCGHMACNISGLPGNKDVIIRKAKALLDNALGDANKGQPWKMTSRSSDLTNLWMRQAIADWFSTPATEARTDSSDGYFLNDDGVIKLILSNDMQEGSTEFITGDFSIEPDP